MTTRRPADSSNPSQDPEGVKVKDLPRSEEELTAAQAEEAVGGATPVSRRGGDLCWLENRILDSCWVENKGKF
jgi:hypothetical protein